MKIKMIKRHSQYAMGQDHEVTDERGNYLIKTGAAEKVEESAAKEKAGSYPDEMGAAPKDEKVKPKKVNVSTSKPRKKSR